MNLRSLAIASIVPMLALGCGHSEDEWKAQLAKYNELHDRSASDREGLEQRLAAAQQRVDDLEGQLRAAGFDLRAKSGEVAKLAGKLDQREKALAEYEARARHLDELRARFALLRKKLDELVHLGIDVTIRHNRMVISLPGDVLFDTGKDTLSKGGQEILRKVAAALRADRSLAERDYQVAGHTDNQPLAGGPFHDNWGLSLMRARSVLIFLIGKGGALPRQHWSAAGFGDTDPVAPNTSKDNQQKNRRCDLIVVPDAEDMMDLEALLR
jgi:chemotaxis protein MotB